MKYPSKNFTPYASYTVSASTTSANTVVAQPAIGEAVTDFLVQNAASSTAFLAWGTTAQTATSAGFPVLAGSIMTISAGTVPITNIAVILESGTGNVYISTGAGA